MAYRAFCILTALCFGQAVTAQESGNGISFRLGIGPQVQPDYFGSEDSSTTPTGSFELERLQWGGLRAGGEERYGLRFTPSARFIQERKASDFSELDGLDDIDFAVELGGGVAYRSEAYEVFAHLRHGVTGHDALVGELGGDIVLTRSDTLTIKAGPRFFWGDDDYAQTYFGVSDSEAAASGFDPFDANAGFLSAGLEAEARYSFNEDWGLVGKIRYDQLQEDAADSPITESEDQVTASIVVTRLITFGF